MYTHRMSRRGWYFYKEAKSQLLLVMAMYCCALLFSADTQALQINGVANYQELNNDYYIAALYADEQQSDSQWWLSANEKKKMVLLIQVSQWSPRSWFKKWQNNFAINHSIDAFSNELQQQLIAFSRLPKGDLQKGDQIEVLYSPNKGTQISLNGHTVLTSSGQPLFHALVSTWIGQLPPSRLFKQQILGMDKGEQREAWTSTLLANKVSLQRQQAIVNWYMTPEVRAKQAEQKRLAEKQERKIRQAEAARKKAEASLAIKLKAIQAKRLAEEEKQTQLAKAQLEKEKREQLQKEQELALAKKLKAERLIQERKRKERLVEQNQKYYKRFYEWQLQSAIRSHISYPEWARKFKEQGLIEASFNVNRAGKITSIKLPDTAPSMLAAEMRRAIGMVSEKIQPPNELKGENWLFGMRHSFKFGSNKQAALVPPIKPTQL